LKESYVLKDNIILGGYDGNLSKISINDKIEYGGFLTLGIISL